MVRRRNFSRHRAIQGRGSFSIRSSSLVLILMCAAKPGLEGIVRQAPRQERVPAQLPGRSWISGKNRSFHDFGASFSEPTLAMKAANFIAFSGAMVQRTCGPEMTAVTFSSGSFDLT